MLGDSGVAGVKGKNVMSLTGSGQHKEARIQMPPVEVGNVLGLLMGERGGDEDEKSYSITQGSGEQWATFSALISGHRNSFPWPLPCQGFPKGFETSSSLP